MHLKTELQGAHTDKSKANVCGTKSFLINSSLPSSKVPDGCLPVLSQIQYKCEISARFAPVYYAKSCLLFLIILSLT